MIYQEIPVPTALQDYLLCFWKFTGPDRVQGGRLQHFIMPDASSSLIYFFHPSSGYLGSGLVGPTKYIWQTTVFEKAVTIGIRFKPGLTPGMFGISGLELRDAKISPAPELPHLDHTAVLDKLGKNEAVWTYFREQLPLSFEALTPQPHPAVAGALKLILDSKGNLKMSDLSERVPLSERQLQKVFKREVGLSPKEFATVMRLRDAIIQMELEQKDYQDTVFDSGYYDQAHFIRDFSKLSKISLPAFKKYIKNIRHIDVTYRQ